MNGVIKNKQGIKWQVINSSINIPVLVMLINPSDISVSLKKIINRTRTKGGFAEEHWGNDLNSIQANGKTAMFYDNKGLTTKNRRASEAMDNFHKLVSIYRNNAVEYNESNEIVRVGRIRMFFGSKIYDGYFESFNINEEAEEPFVFPYDFSFKVIRTYGGYSLEKVYSINNFISVTEKPVIVPTTPVSSSAASQTSVAGIEVPVTIQKEIKAETTVVEKNTELQAFDIISDDLAPRTATVQTTATPTKITTPTVVKTKDVATSNTVVKQALTKPAVKNDEKKNTGQLNNVQAKPTKPVAKKETSATKPVVAKKPEPKPEVVKRDVSKTTKAQQQTAEPPKKGFFSKFFG
jgi:hypothetical protein